MASLGNARLGASLRYDPATPPLALPVPTDTAIQESVVGKEERLVALSKARRSVPLALPVPMCDREDGSTRGTTSGFAVDGIVKGKRSAWAPVPPSDSHLTC